MKSCALMASGELNFNGVIDLTRFMTSIKYIGSSIKSEDIWYLADQSKCGSIEEEE